MRIQFAFHLVRCATTQVHEAACIAISKQDETANPLVVCVFAELGGTMRIAFMPLLLVTVTASNVCFAAQPSPKDAERYIREGEAAWVQAELKGDPSVARRILADDYVGVFPDGTVGTKPDAVGFFKPSAATTAGRLDYLHVRFFGTTAVAQGKETDMRPKTSPLPSGSLIFTDVWLYRNGQWQIVNSEDQFQPLPK